jgi:hypothetical protein
MRGQHGMGKIGPKRPHAKRALGAGFGRPGMVGTVTKGEEAGFRVHRGRGKRR